MPKMAAEARRARREGWLRCGQECEVVVDSPQRRGGRGERDGYVMGRNVKWWLIHRRGAEGAERGMVTLWAGM